LDAVTRLAEVEDNPDKHREASQVLEHFEKAPVAQPICHPLPEPFERSEWDHPAMFETCHKSRPPLGPLSYSVRNHSVPPAAIETKMCCIYVVESLVPSHSFNFSRIASRTLSLLRE